MYLCFYQIPLLSLTKIKNLGDKDSFVGKLFIFGSLSCSILVGKIISMNIIHILCIYSFCNLYAVSP